MTSEQVYQLLEARAVPHATRDLSLVETHISWVLLGSRYVYKIKKPVSLGFLDFSTLEKRRGQCENEVRLNKRLAPEMYLGILPVRRGPVVSYIGSGSCEIIDYAVLMLRMDDSRQLDLLLKKGEVEVSDLDRLAHKIADFHRNALVVPEGEQWEELYREFADILYQLPVLEKIGGADAVKEVEAACHWAKDFLKRIEGRIVERNRAGFVIDGHGDLHCRNIFMLEDPVVFDCIEFNDDFRKLDVLSEIAFLCMDLERLDREDLSRRFLDHYQAEFPCIQNDVDEQLFLFYKMYRANVRMKVTAIQLDGEVKMEGAQEKSALLMSYFTLFGQYFKNLAPLK